MNKRNRIIALGGIIAVSGCTGGGKTALPATKPAQAANRPLSTGHLTINPTLLRHASRARRRPSFVDVNGGGNLSLQITSVTKDASALQPAVTCIPLTIGQGSISASMPLYGPAGYLRIQEYSQASTVCPVSIDALLLADTDSNFEQDVTSPLGGFGNVAYSITIGADSPVSISGTNTANGAVTLQAVIGGIVLADTPDGSDSFGNFFFPNDNPNALGYTASFIPSPLGAGGSPVYTFAADALGNFTNLAVPGAFPNAVQLVPGQSFGVINVGQTNIPGVFSLSTGASGCGSAPPQPVNFQATDALGNFAFIPLVINFSGYLGSGC